MKWTVLRKWNGEMVCRMNWYNLPSDQEFYAERQRQRKRARFMKNYLLDIRDKETQHKEDSMLGTDVCVPSWRKRALG